MKTDSIEVRDFDFGLDRSIPRHWHGSGRAVTMFWNGMSIFFPHGEKFFVTSVKAHRNFVTDEKLAEQVRLFCKQEGIHSREHVQYNRLLAEHGYPAEELGRSTEQMYKWVNRLTWPRLRLAATAAMEHFTAILGDATLEFDGQFAGSNSVMASLWRWHAAEEVEHKSVAYDVYLAAGGNYVERSAVMVLTTFIYVTKVLEHQVRMMSADGILLSATEWQALFSYLFRSSWSGPLGRSYLHWYKPGFHPNDIDDGHLLETWKESLSEAYTLFAA